MNMRILYIAYPLLTVSEDSAGGAEQVLWTLAREMSRRGIDTTVAASAGSDVAGRLFVTGDPCSQTDDFERRNHDHQARIVELVCHRRRAGAAFDLVHDMSGSFWPRAMEFDAPLLATLHLPRHFYPPHLFENIPANVSFSCVSQTQAGTFHSLGALAGVVANGIALDRFALSVDKGGEKPRGLLWLGRICEEKAPHLALEIAQRSGVSITLAGQVYPFSYHQNYFEEEVIPRLQQIPGATFLSAPSAQTKRRLLRQAQAVLITSQVEETSSLVAMEAAASGTPVIAFARGALQEIVRDGVTGFLIENVEEAARAVRRLGEIDPGVCVRHTHQHFSGSTMAEKYCELYQQARSSGLTLAPTEL
ncbi:MAG TPA: glycosyltransferase [Candidatus Angelobacter sp.]|nr:glycosyltransferase [Candidatus Angelobacter sp.]